MLIKKIKTKLKTSLFRLKRILVTRFKYFFKSSDKERWSQEKSLFNSWDERTQLLGDLITNNTTVFEFGAARLVLKDFIPDGCTYLHSDIVKRNDDTLVLDLNKELPNIPKVDYIVFSGVLEYVFEVENLIKHLSNFTDNFILSYATIDNFPDTNTRRFNGWVSDLSKNSILSLAEGIGFKSTVVGSWKKQTLFKFSK